MIEKALPEDIQQIVSLIASEKGKLIPRPYDEVLANIHNFVVIRDGSNIVACASFEDYSPKIAEIRSLVIVPEYRKKGYGKLLIEHLKERAKPGQEVFVVTSSIGFFNKLGFENNLEDKQVLFYQKPRSDDTIA